MMDGQSVIMNEDGEVFDFTPDFYQPIFCINAPLMVRNSGHSFTQRLENFYDIAELLAFIYPASGVMPTLKDILSFCQIKQENLPEIILYQKIIAYILNNINNFPAHQKKSLIEKLHIAYGCRWPWVEVILDFLGISIAPKQNIAQQFYPILANFENLPRNEQKKSLSYDKDYSINFEAAKACLNTALDGRGEARPQQLEYVSQISKVFSHDGDQQKIILCEAETGTGKTLGYLAPAIAWAEKNQRPAVISTYSKALQNQVASELKRFFPKPQAYDEAVVMRKGRENYLCLRQYQAALMTPNIKPIVILYLTMIARWIEVTKTGDLSDIYFPLWITEFFPNIQLPKLTVNSQACTYSQCPFYSKCFAEKANAKSEKTRIIVTNHAFLMSKFKNSPMNDEFSGAMIIDEAHQIFPAADNIYLTTLNIRTLNELKIALLGHKNQSGQLLMRYDELINVLEYADLKHDMHQHVMDIIQLCHQFPDISLKSQQKSDMLGSVTANIYYELMHNIQNILWDSFTKSEEISLEAYQEETNDDIFDDVYNHLRAILKTLDIANYRLEKFLKEITDPEAIPKVSWFKDFLIQKVQTPISEYYHIISEFHKNKEKLDTEPVEVTNFVTHFISDPLRQAQGSVIDHDNQNNDKNYFIYCYKNKFDKDITNLSLIKRYLNPTEFFGMQILSYVKRVVLTSAGMRASHGDDGAGWDFAQELVGLKHSLSQPLTAYVKSDFDYEKQAKIMIINDISGDNPAAYQKAFLDMVKASDGGVLGIFTAISRLKDCYKNIVTPLRQHKILTLAMHQAMANNQTLIELFKQDGNAVLLGTDLMRDGIDIPGSALRLVVFDRIPWQRPDLIYKQRKRLFQKYGYDKFIVRQKLKQAFGRLIRTKKDYGCFVLVASRCPSDLLEAFPQESQIMRVSASEAIKALEGVSIKDFGC